jgi:hypothetical protein
MILNIIHLSNRVDRWDLLQKELQQQNIIEYKIWNGIVDPILILRGISKAHKQIIKDAKEKNLPEVLIGEDDLYFTAKDAFQFFMDNKPSDYDIYLSGVLYGRIKSDNTIADFSGATLYMVSERFYETFLSVPENIHIDRALRNMGKFVVCNPFVVIQHNGFSDNKKQYCNYEPLLKNRKLFGYSKFPPLSLVS